MLRLFFVVTLLFTSAKGFAQQRGLEEFNYSGVFKFDPRGSESAGLNIDWSRFSLLAAAGSRFHRYDPIRISDDNHISSFSDTSLFLNLNLEYRFLGFLSLIGNSVWESQKVQRYDGVEVENDDPYTREVHLGLQLNYDPFFVSYELGQWEFPHFYLGNNDEFTHENIKLGVDIIRAGFRRNINENFALSFSLDHTNFRKNNSSTFGNMDGEVLGANILILHHSGFGLKLREEQGHVESDNYDYKIKAFSIIPFVSL